MGNQVLVPGAHLLVWACRIWDALVLLGSGHLSACSCSPGTVASNPPAPQRATLGWYPEAQPKPHSSTFQACCQHLLPCATPLCLKEPKRVASVVCN